MSFIPSLDHIIILVPHHVLSSLPTSITSAFTIYPGGTHADNKTTNSLILLKSGVYLELISFVNDDPQNKEGHWWGTKIPGTIIDFALTSKSTSDIEIVRKALSELDGKCGLQVGYQESKKGGRKRPDGESVEWEVTFPSPSISRGTVAFWCHDITSRELRVPVQTAKHSTEHPSGVIGVSKFILVVSPEIFETLIEIYARILGSEGTKVGNGDVSFDITQPIPGSSTSSIILRKAQTPEEKAVVQSNGGTAGIWEVILAVTGEVPPTISEKIGEGLIRIGFEKVAD